MDATRSKSLRGTLALLLGAKGIATRSKGHRYKEQEATRGSWPTARSKALLGAKGIATRNKKLVGAPRHTTKRSKSQDATRSKGHRY